MRLCGLNCFTDARSSTGARIAVDDGHTRLTTLQVAANGLRDMRLGTCWKRSLALNKCFFGQTSCQFGHCLVNWFGWCGWCGLVWLVGLVGLNRLVRFVIVTINCYSYVGRQPNHCAHCGRTWKSSATMSTSASTICLSLAMFCSAMQAFLTTSPDCPD